MIKAGILSLNFIIITFANIPFGKSIILFLGILFNTLFYFANRIKFKSQAYHLWGILFLSYIFLRQIILFLAENPTFHFENFSMLIFTSYSLSFIVFCNFLNKNHLPIFIVCFIVCNFIFGFLDYFGVSYLHESNNMFSRFRGLSEEPNLIIPILVMFYFMIDDVFYSKLINLLLKLLILSMIIFSSSKAGILLFFIIFLIETFRSQNFRRMIFIAIVFLFSFLYLQTLFLNSDFFIKFISLVFNNPNLSLDIVSFIKSLNEIDQFISGSLSTRLATFYASIYLFFTNFQIFIIGAGGGESYIYIQQLIYELGINSYEINIHRLSQPKYITDKTFLLKFTIEYGLIGFIIIFSFLRKLAMNNILLIYFILLLLFTQNYFILCFMYLFSSLKNAININSNT